MKFIEQCYADASLFLLADEELIDSAENAEFKICVMEKHPEPVLRPTEIWEGGDGTKQRPVQSDPIDGTVLYNAEDKKFHLWYRIHNSRLRKNPSFAKVNIPTEGSQVCYATSPDGINWEKPVIGQVPYEQSFENNMLKVDKGMILSDHVSGVVPNYTDNIDAPLIATIFSKFDDPIYPQGITFMTSQDGLDWNPHYPPSIPMDGDAHCLMYDWHRNCYICTTRAFIHSHEVRLMQKKGFHDLRNKRHIAIAQSRDLIHWTPMMPVLEADDKDAENAQLYYMYILPYGHGYIGFVQLFYISADMTYGPLEMELTFSRDLTTWQRVGDRTPIIPRGEKGSWDQSHTSICTNPPHPEGDKLRFWYGGKDTEHWQSGNGSLNTATLRRDGFACYEAGEKEAVVTTNPLYMKWATKIFLSADAEGGEIRVEMLDADTMEPLEGTSNEDCQPMTTNSTKAKISFSERRGSFVRNSGKVRFRFYIKNAKLYGFYASNCSVNEVEDTVNIWR